MEEDGAQSTDSQTGRAVVDDSHEKPIDQSATTHFAMANTTDAATFFPFQRLQPELRNEIYALYLRAKYGGRITLPCAIPALAQTNRQIRNELLPMLFTDCQVAVRPAMEQYVQYSIFPTRDEDMKSRLQSWLETQRRACRGGLLTSAKEFHFTIGVNPQPLYFCEGERALQAYRSRTPFVEVIFRFEDKVSEPEAMTAGLDQTGTCGLCRIARRSFKNTALAASRTRPHLSVLHVTIPGCTLLALFGMPANLTSSGRWTVEDLRATQYGWMCEVVPFLQLLSVARRRGRGTLWKGLLEAMEKLHHVEEGNILKSMERRRVELAKLRLLYSQGLRWSSLLGGQ